MLATGTAHGSYVSASARNAWMQVCETYETSVLRRAVLQRDPAANRTWWVGVEEGRVVVTRDWSQLWSTAKASELMRVAAALEVILRRRRALLKRSDYSPTPPIRGCLQMIMVWSTRGSLMSFDRLRATSLTFSEVVTSRNAGSASRPCPILLMDREGGYSSFGGSSLDSAEGSRKYRIWCQLVVIPGPAECNLYC